MINHDEVETCEVCQVQHDCGEVSETDTGFICEPCQGSKIDDLLKQVADLSHSASVEGVATNIVETDDLIRLIINWHNGNY